MELSARKKQILKRVIEDYIASAEPVGSKAIAQEMGGSVSSATVRNELAELSDLGYLEQPHTSAGRVPSPKGYRLYVNELMERREVSEAEAEEINETLQDKMSAAGSMISQAGQMASSIVDYPAYAVAEGKSGVTVKRFELLGVDDTSFITVVMTDDSRVKSQLQRSPLAFDRARLTDLSALLNTHFTRQSREEMSAKLMGLSDQIAPELFLVLSATVGYAAEILEEAAKKDVFTTGASQILKMPEYRDLDKAHDLMTFFVDNKENLPVPEDDTPLKILIGPENVNEARATYNRLLETINALNVEIATAKEKIETSNTLSNSDKKMILGLGTEKETINKRLKDIEGLQAKMTQKLEEVQAAQVKLREKLEHLKRTLSAENTAKEGIQRLYSDKRYRLAVLVSNIEATVKEIANNKLLIDKAKDEIQSKQSYIEQIKTSIDLLYATLNESATNKALQEEMNQLLEKIKETDALRLQMESEYQTSFRRPSNVGRRDTSTVRQHRKGRVYP